MAASSSSFVPPLFHLCLLLTRELCKLKPIDVLEAAVAGGVDCVQIREKNMSSNELVRWGQEVQQHCRRLNVPLVINDNVEVAWALRADGVHLGQEDMDVETARRLLGAQVWIGLSTHDLEQADEAIEIGATYAGFGPIFATQTKGYTQGLGPEYLAAAMAIARLPLVALGGLSPANIWMIPEQAGIAVSSAICAAEDPQTAAQFLRNRRSP